MKKFVSITLRLILAALGIGYIVWTLSWSDQVLLPAGYTLEDGKVLEQEVVLPVKAVEPGEQYVLQWPETGKTFTVYVPVDTVTADKPRHKPGIISLMHGANWWLLLLGLALILPIFPIQALRWWLLMRCRGMRVSYARAFRLTMVGQFFNFCMPGMTGGDVVKAYYAAKGSGQRGIAVMSVIFDRAAGLLGLVMLAGIAGLVMLLRGELDDDLRKLVLTVTVLIWLGFFSFFVVAYLYFARRVRNKIGLQKLIDRMGPGNILVRLDDAAATYRDHKKVILITILISLPVHIAQSMATTCAGWSLGMGLSAGLMLTVLPVLFLAGSVPLTYQGLGVMEALAVAMLLPSQLADANQLVSMLVMIRVYLIIYALIGAVMMLKGDIHLHPQLEKPEGEAKAAEGERSSHG